MEKLTDFYQANRNIKYQYPQIPEGKDKFNWIMMDGKIPYLPMLLDGPWKEILAEVKQFDDLFVAHRDDGQTSGWSSLCLHGLGADKTDAPSVYPEFRDILEDQLPWDWTEISPKCPVATEYFKNVFPYDKYFRLRFMRLAPSGYIGAHVDAKSFILGAVNISLNNPEGCEMVLGGIGVVPFKDSGGAMAFNTSYEHIVWNQSTEPRYHMIVHGQWNWLWQKAVVDSYDYQLTL